MSEIRTNRVASIPEVFLVSGFLVLVGAANFIFPGIYGLGVTVASAAVATGLMFFLRSYVFTLGVILITYGSYVVWWTTRDADSWVSFELNEYLGSITPVLTYRTIAFISESVCLALAWLAFTSIVMLGKGTAFTPFRRLLLAALCNLAGIITIMLAADHLGYFGLTIEDGIAQVNRGIFLFLMTAGLLVTSLIAYRQLSVAEGRDLIHAAYVATALSTLTACLVMQLGGLMLAAVLLVLALLLFFGASLIQREVCHVFAGLNLLLAAGLAIAALAG